MSVFNSSIYTRLTTELFGFGVTLNPDGSVLSVTGATVEYVTVAPTATRNGGSMALRSDGTAYMTAGAGVWFAIGGAGSGFALPNDIAGTWGTTAPLRVSSTYVSASNRWDLQGGNTTDAQASTGFRYRSGTVTNSLAGAGGASGPLNFATGPTDCTNAGGTGGISGQVQFITGDANSTLGTSGNTGPVEFITGNSADGNSGDIVFTIGTAGGTRGTIQAIGILTTTDGVPAGNVRRIGGSVLRTVAESAPVSGAEAAFAGGAVSLSGGTLKVGTRVYFSALIRVASISGGPTAQIRVRINAAGVGGTLAFDTTARTVADEDIIALEGYLDVRSTGAGTATGTMQYRISAPDTLASAAAAEWAQDVAGSVAGTWTVALTDTTVATNFTLSGQTDDPATTLMLESARVWLEA